MTDFAPGNWGVHSGTFSVYSNFGRSVIKIADTHQKLFTPECQRANARLIAAAPDLLKTLKTVDDYLAIDRGDGDKWRDIRVIIQAAIAKAKG